MQISEQQIKAILSLPAQERYSYFVKQVADSEEVWGLYNDGWAISVDDAGVQSLPVWSAREYADLVRTGEWELYEPKSRALDEFLEEMLPDLQEKNILIAVSYIPADEGVVVEANRLIEDIKQELTNY